MSHAYKVSEYAARSVCVFKCVRPWLIIDVFWILLTSYVLMLMYIESRYSSICIKSPPQQHQSTTPALLPSSFQFLPINPSFSTVAINISCTVGCGCVVRERHGMTFDWPDISREVTLDERFNCSQGDIQPPNRVDTAERFVLFLCVLMSSDKPERISRNRNQALHLMQRHFNPSPMSIVIQFFNLRLENIVLAQTQKAI